MITIIKPGLLSSVQDLGRFGYQKYGVIASGVMDPLAHRIANLLVGNDENMPTVEITLLGPTIQFHQDTLIAICGGSFSPTINGKQIPSWRSVFVKKDSLLKFGKCDRDGCRAYLAVSGGISVPLLMGSASTYLRAGIGGFNGRALVSGDHLSIGAPSFLATSMIHFFTKKLKEDFIESGWSVSHISIPIQKRATPVRIIKGKEFHLFSKEGQEYLFNKSFEITTESDRMGYRLQGTSLFLEKSQEMVSEAVNFGTIQVPPDGNPIILMADRQTTGGYPKIGQIATVDLTTIAQSKPGDNLTFKEVSHIEAQQLLLQREKAIRHLKKGIYLQFQ